MFVDASAIVAILMEEKGGEALAAKLEARPNSVTNAIAVWEAAAAIHRRWGVPQRLAHMRVEAFLDAGEIAILPVSSSDVATALAVFESHGRHRYPDPRQRNKGLNVADCFHYATAKSHGDAILTLDAAFGLTDLTILGPEPA